MHSGNEGNSMLWTVYKILEAVFRIRALLTKKTCIIIELDMTKVTCGNMSATCSYHGGSGSFSYCCRGIPSVTHSGTKGATAFKCL